MKAFRYGLSASNGDADSVAGFDPVPSVPSVPSVPEDLVGRILAPGDWDFISCQPSASVQRLFYRERKAILLSWLRRLRRHVARLIKTHRETVRPHLHFDLASESKLLGDTAAFFGVYAAAQAVIRGRGPLQAAALLSKLTAIVKRLQALVEARRAEIDPAHLDRVPTAPAAADDWPSSRRAQKLVKNLEIEAAIEAVKKRELTGLHSEFSGLTYLASVRDYNSARYYHESLARRFTQEVMEQALATCHREVFQRLAHCTMEETVQQLDGYVLTTPESPAKVLHAWSRLEPFRVLMPLDCDPLSADLFVSNVRVGLSILQEQALADELLCELTDLPVNP